LIVLGAEQADFLESEEVSSVKTVLDRREKSCSNQGIDNDCPAGAASLRLTGAVIC
jgi:hypothetical protein